MSRIVRQQHWTDVPIIGQGPDKRKRIIKNWSNYKEPNRPWRPSGHKLKQVDFVPESWSGQFDFKHMALEGPIQVFLGDSTTPSNTALVGFRRSDKPGSWMNLKAIGIDNASTMEVFKATKTVRWQELWNNCDLGFRLANHKLEKIIKLKNPGHAAYFRFALRIPSDHTYDITNGILTIKDDQGETVIESRMAYGWDSSTVAPTVDGKQYIRVDVTEDSPILIAGKSYPVIRVTPNADDLSSAVYPVFVDPTTTISGTSDIEDNQLNQAAPTTNFGINTCATNAAGGGNDRSTVYRINTAQIPTGTITAMRLLLYQWSLATSSIGDGVNIYAIKNGNDWVEGTALASPQPGSSCWSGPKYLSQNWLGSVGCSTSGTDYVADGSPPNFDYPPYTAGADKLWTISLIAQWATDWRDSVGAISNNEGIILKSKIVSNNKLFLIRSTEEVNPPTFEIDYYITSQQKVLLLSDN